MKLRGAPAKDSRWISRHGDTRRDVLRDDTAGSHDCILANGESAQKRRPGTDRSPSLHNRSLAGPVCLGLKFAVTAGGLRNAIVDERNPVTDEDSFFYFDSFADEGVA